MSLADFLAEVARRRKTLTVFAPEQYERLGDHFETRNVTVEHETLPDDGSGGFVVVSENGEFVGSVGGDAVRELVAPPTTFGTAPSEATQALLNLLADTTFVSFDKRQMLATSREIEDRAFRCGRGTLRTGFQSLSALRAQERIYELLANKEGLDVHVYGRPDWSPEIPGVTVHTDETPEIGAFWFVVFDGGRASKENETGRTSELGTTDEQACALLAEEGEPHTFSGFWTYDPELVGELDDYLHETYG
ncbi:DICT sensory domain-containing protein [Halorussus halophilus]|uniref:DICT sensory domain-containing protein n=1 Tax=Halorussus halophilus TaxID=2650975 RepID=UPI001301618C|nr:DICT sensory domain-containing protein [Halorussus halophilus]